MATSSQPATAPASAGSLTPEELDYLRSGLARELPHLSCTVELLDGTLYVKAVKA